MGLFDNVNVKLPCPDCGTQVEGFQSKDRDCILDTIDPNCVKSFYSSCPNCERQIKYRRNVPMRKARSRPFTLYEIEDLGFELQ